MRFTIRTRGIIAVVAAVAGLVALAPSSGAASSVTTSRIAGDDRYGTAAGIAAAAYPTGADTVLVASGRSYPDALSGAALAGRQGSPVLLTEPGTLPKATSDAVTTLKATKAVILGGTTAVSQGVEDQLAKQVSVSRISGGDRYETAAKIAAAIGATNIGSVSSRRTALIATGLGFADALAGGPLAAAGSGGVLPVLLVDSGVPAATRKALTDLGIKQTIILGGTGVVSPSVATELQQITGNVPTRLAGNDRYATAAAIATSEVADFAFDKTKVLLANGTNFADALAGGALGGKQKTPILLTDANALPAPTSTYLTDNNKDIASITALGGSAAVSDATLAAAKTAAQPKPGTSGITVTPADEAFLTADGQSSRTYTASGLTGQVDIALLGCELVGENTFTNSNSNTTVDGTSSGASAPDKASTGASISTVNGAPNLSSNNDYADDASPSDGKVTFAVAAPSSGTGCVIPVVFTDANSDDALNSNAAPAATPTEVYGLGGKLQYGPALASAGTFTDRTVQSADKSSDRFAACTATQTCNSYPYDSGDDFQIGGSTVTMAAFEAALSAGDTVGGTFQPQGKSTFNLGDTAPAAPGLVTASQSSGSTAVTVSFPDSSTQTVDSYRIYRGIGSDNTATPLPGDIDCSTTTYTVLPNGTVVDDGQSPTHTYSDTSVSPNTYYCYKVSSIDDGDEGPISTQNGSVKTAA